MKSVMVLIKRMLRLIGCVLVSGLLHVTSAYPFGAGMSACVTLIPGHGVVPQPMETLPYMIEPQSDSFVPGKVFKVRIKTASGKSKNRKVGGFLIQARAPGTTEPVGRWEVHHEESHKHGVRERNCSHPFDSVTHMDPKPKTADIILHFFPTSNTPDTIQFVGTIARDYATFWANVKSSIVTRRLVHHEADREIFVYPPTTTTEQPATHVPLYHQTMATLPSAVPVTHSPKRIHHVTIEPKTTPAHHHHRASHHPRRTTTTPTTTTTVLTTTPMDLLSKYRIPEEKILEDKELASIIAKNELEALKRNGLIDDQSADVQNDGNANPDSQAIKTNRSKSGNTASSAPSFTIRRIWSSPALMGQLLFFVCSWILFL